MAETIALTLVANGSTIPGDNTLSSLGRENTIECLSYEQALVSSQDASSGLATGRRRYGPIIIRKRIDRSSPLLAQALCNNEVIEATFRFFRPSPSGDGTTQQFYTVALTQGRVISFKQLLPSTLDSATAAQPYLEEVWFSYRQITWTYTPDGIEFTDSLGSST